MTDTEQTIEEPLDAQPEPAGADAPGDGAPESSEARAPGDGQVDEDAAELEGDLDELVDVAAERDEYLALAQRTQADFENYRKRVARESAAAMERGVAKLCKELLGALDNLDRALGAAAQDDPLLEGVRLVRAELSAGLGARRHRILRGPRRHLRPGSARGCGHGPATSRGGG